MAGSVKGMKSYILLLLMHVMQLLQFMQLMKRHLCMVSFLFSMSFKLNLLHDCFHLGTSSEWVIGA